ncbi:hypothetical protein LCGC14_2280880 [marine sediment metagenome]|uniref:Uncharacterized protein n=1 Tax=marine sediment metagenome TaxID=412755 RepID=A0A0F9FPD5_9ZZZZ
MPTAKELIAIGMQQAKARQFSASPPDLDADKELVDALVEEEDPPNPSDLELLAWDRWDV